MHYIDPRHKVLHYPGTLATMQHGESVYPLHVEFDLSNRCNLRCKWCDFAYMQDRSVMPAEIAVHIMEQLREVGVLALTLSGGGEPTCCPDFVPIVRVAKKQMGFRLGLYTNGIQGGRIQEVMDHLDWVYVSLDELSPNAYRESKGIQAHETVTQNIQRLAEHDGTVLGVGFLLHEDNYADAPKMQILARQLGADYAQLRPVVGLDKYGWVPEALRVLDALDGASVNRQRFVDLYDNWRGEYERGYTICRGSELVPCVGADGMLWVCPNMRGKRKLGDLSKETFADVWVRRETQMVGADCRIACRNHYLNQTLDYVCEEQIHGEFV